MTRRSGICSCLQDTHYPNHFRTSAHAAFHFLLRVMYDEWWQQIEHEEQLITPGEEQVVKAFLDGKVSAEEAATRYREAASKKEDPDAFYIWSFLQDVAREFDEAQDKLVALIRDLEKLPEVARNGQIVASWSGADFFGMCYYDSWRGMFNVNHRRSTECHHTDLQAQL